MAPTYVKTQRDLARALGVTPGRVSHYKREPWWPGPTPDGFDVEAIRRAVESHRKRPAVNGTPAPRQPVAQVRPAQASPLPVGSDQTPIEILRAAVQLAAGVVAAAHESGTLGVREFDSLKKATDALRLGEAALLKLEVDRGELVPRDVAAEVAGYLGQRCRETVDDIRSRLAPQVSIWLGDPAFMALGDRERQREVSAWITERAHGLLATTARDLEELIGEVSE